MNETVNATGESIFIINDIELEIPPTQISIQKEDLFWSWKTLRTKIATKIPSGHGVIHVQLNMIFVPDQLITLHRLVTEFRNSPYCYIKNSYLRNNICDSWPVGQNMAFTMTGIDVSSLSEHPGSFQVQISLRWFNYFPYTPNFVYKKDFLTKPIEHSKEGYHVRFTIPTISGSDLSYKQIPIVQKNHNAESTVEPFSAVTEKIVTKNSGSMTLQEMQKTHAGEIFDLSPLPDMMASTTFANPYHSNIYKRYINVLQQKYLYENFGIDLYEYFDQNFIKEKYKDSIYDCFTIGIRDEDKEKSAQKESKNPLKVFGWHEYKMPDEIKGMVIVKMLSLMHEFNIFYNEYLAIQKSPLLIDVDLKIKKEAGSVIANKYQKDLQAIASVSSPSSSVNEVTFAGSEEYSDYLSRIQDPKHSGREGKPTMPEGQTAYATQGIIVPASGGASQEEGYRYFHPLCGAQMYNGIQSVVNLTISSGYGWRIRTWDGNKVQHHEGIDLIASIDGKRRAEENAFFIRAPLDGVITRITNTKGGYGRRIELEHADGMKTTYAHLGNEEKGKKVYIDSDGNAREPKKGDIVKRGQVFATIGNTGGSTGSHIHFEVKINGKTTDPYPYLIVSKAGIAAAAARADGSGDTGTTYDVNKYTMSEEGFDALIHKWDYTFLKKLGIDTDKLYYPKQTSKGIVLENVNRLACGFEYIPAVENIDSRLNVHSDTTVLHENALVPNNEWVNPNTKFWKEREGNIMLATLNTVSAYDFIYLSGDLTVDDLRSQSSDFKHALSMARNSYYLSFLEDEDVKTRLGAEQSNTLKSYFESLINAIDFTSSDSYTFPLAEIPNKFLLSAFFKVKGLLSEPIEDINFSIKRGMLASKSIVVPSKQKLIDVKTGEEIEREIYNVGTLGIDTGFLYDNLFQIDYRDKILQYTTEGHQIKLKDRWILRDTDYLISGGFMHAFLNTLGYNPAIGSTVSDFFKAKIAKPKKFSNYPLTVLDRYNPQYPERVESFLIAGGFKVDDQIKNSVSIPKNTLEFFIYKIAPENISPRYLCKVYRGGDSDWSLFPEHIVNYYKNIRDGIRVDLNSENVKIDLLNIFHNFTKEVVDNYLYIPESDTLLVGSKETGISLSIELGKELVKTQLYDIEKTINGRLKNKVSQTQFDTLVSLAWDLGIDSVVLQSIILALNENESKETIERLIRKRSNYKNVFGKPTIYKYPGVREEIGDESITANENGSNTSEQAHSYEIALDSNFSETESYRMKENKEESLYSEMNQNKVTLDNVVSKVFKESFDYSKVSNKITDNFKFLNIPSSIEELLNVKEGNDSFNSTLTASYRKFLTDEDKLYRYDAWNHEFENTDDKINNKVDIGFKNLNIEKKIKFKSNGNLSISNQKQLSVDETVFEIAKVSRSNVLVSTVYNEAKAKVISKSISTMPKLSISVCENDKLWANSFEFSSNKKVKEFEHVLINDNSGYIKNFFENSMKDLSPRIKYNSKSKKPESGFENTKDWEMQNLYNCIISELSIRERSDSEIHVPNVAFYNGSKVYKYYTPKIMEVNFHHLILKLFMYQMVAEDSPDGKDPFVNFINPSAESSELKVDIRKELVNIIGETELAEIEHNIGVEASLNEGKVEDGFVWNGKLTRENYIEVIGNLEGFTDFNPWRICLIDDEVDAFIKKVQQYDVNVDKVFEAFTPYMNRDQIRDLQAEGRKLNREDFSKSYSSFIDESRFNEKNLETVTEEKLLNSNLTRVGEVISKLIVKHSFDGPNNLKLLSEAKWKQHHFTSSNTETLEEYRGSLNSIEADEKYYKIRNKVKDKYGAQNTFGMSSEEFYKNLLVNKNFGKLGTVSGARTRKELFEYMQKESEEEDGKRLYLSDDIFTQNELLFYFNTDRYGTYGLNDLDVGGASGFLYVKKEADLNNESELKDFLTTNIVKFESEPKIIFDNISNFVVKKADNGFPYFSDSSKEIKREDSEGNVTVERVFTRKKYMSKSFEWYLYKDSYFQKKDESDEPSEYNAQQGFLPFQNPLLDTHNDFAYNDLRVNDITFNPSSEATEQYAMDSELFNVPLNLGFLYSDVVSAIRRGANHLFSNREFFNAVSMGSIFASQYHWDESTNKLVLISGTDVPEENVSDGIAPKELIGFLYDLWIKEKTFFPLDFSEIHIVYGQEGINHDLSRESVAVNVSNYGDAVRDKSFLGYKDGIDLFVNSMIENEEIDELNLREERKAVVKREFEKYIFNYIKNNNIDIYLEDFSDQEEKSFDIEYTNFGLVKDLLEYLNNDSGFNNLLRIDLYKEEKQNESEFLKDPKTNKFFIENLDNAIGYVPSLIKRDRVSEYSIIEKELVTLTATEDGNVIENVNIEVQESLEKEIELMEFIAKLIVKSKREYVNFFDTEDTLFGHNNYSFNSSLSGDIVRDGFGDNQVLLYKLLAKDFFKFPFARYPSAEDHSDSRQIINTVINNNKVIDLIYTALEILGIIKIDGEDVTISSEDYADFKLSYIKNAIIYFNALEKGYVSSQEDKMFFLFKTKVEHKEFFTEDNGFNLKISNGTNINFHFFSNHKPLECSYQDIKDIYLYKNGVTVTNIVNSNNNFYINEISIEEQMVSFPGNPRNETSDYFVHLPHVRYINQLLEDSAIDLIITDADPNPNSSMAITSYEGEGIYSESFYLPFSNLKALLQDELGPGTSFTGRKVFSEYSNKERMEQSVQKLSEILANIKGFADNYVSNIENVLSGSKYEFYDQLLEDGGNTTSSIGFSSIFGAYSVSKSDELISYEPTVLEIKDLPSNPLVKTVSLNNQFNAALKIVKRSEDPIKRSLLDYTDLIEGAIELYNQELSNYIALREVDDFFKFADSIGSEDWQENLNIALNSAIYFNPDKLKGTQAIDYKTETFVPGSLYERIKENLSDNFLIQNQVARNNTEIFFGTYYLELVEISKVTGSKKAEKEWTEQWQKWFPLDTVEPSDAILFEQGVLRDSLTDYPQDITIPSIEYKGFDFYITPISTWKLIESYIRYLINNNVIPKMTIDEEILSSFLIEGKHPFLNLEKSLDEPGESYDPFNPETCVRNLWSDLESISDEDWFRISNEVFNSFISKEEVVTSFENTFRYLKAKDISFLSFSEWYSQEVGTGNNNFGWPRNIGGNAIFAWAQAGEDYVVWNFDYSDGNIFDDNELYNFIEKTLKKTDEKSEELIANILSEVESNTDNINEFNEDYLSKRAYLERESDYKTAYLRLLEIYNHFHNDFTDNKNTPILFESNDNYFYDYSQYYSSFLFSGSEGNARLEDELKWFFLEEAEKTTENITEEVEQEDDISISFETDRLDLTKEQIAAIGAFEEAVNAMYAEGWEIYTDVNGLTNVMKRTIKDSYSNPNYERSLDINFMKKYFKEAVNRGDDIDYRLFIAEAVRVVGSADLSQHEELKDYLTFWKEHIVTRVSGSMSHVVSSIPILNQTYPTSQHLGSIEPSYSIELACLPDLVRADSLNEESKKLVRCLSTLQENSRAFRQVPDSYSFALDSFITRLFGSFSELDYSVHPINPFNSKLLKRICCTKQFSQTVPGSPGLSNLLLTLEETNPYKTEKLNQQKRDTSTNRSAIKDALHALYNLQLTRDARVYLLLKRFSQEFNGIEAQKKLETLNSTLDESALRKITSFTIINDADSKAEVIESETSVFELPKGNMEILHKDSVGEFRFRGDPISSKISLQDLQNLAFEGVYFTDEDVVETVTEENELESMDDNLGESPIYEPSSYIINENWLKDNGFEILVDQEELNKLGIGAGGFLYKRRPRTEEEMEQGRAEYAAAVAEHLNRYTTETGEMPKGPVQFYKQEKAIYIKPVFKNSMMVVFSDEAALSVNPSLKSNFLISPYDEAKTNSILKENDYKDEYTTITTNEINAYKISEEEADFWAMALGGTDLITDFGRDKLGNIYISENKLREYVANHFEYYKEEPISKEITNYQYDQLTRKATVESTEEVTLGYSTQNFYAANPGFNNLIAQTGEATIVLLKEYYNLLIQTFKKARFTLAETEAGGLDREHIKKTLYDFGNKPEQKGIVEPFMYRNFILFLINKFLVGVIPGENTETVRNSRIDRINYVLGYDTKDIHAYFSSIIFEGLYESTEGISPREEETVSGFIPSEASGYEVYVDKDNRIIKPSTFNVEHYAAFLYNDDVDDIITLARSSNMTTTDSILTNIGSDKSVLAGFAQVASSESVIDGLENTLEAFTMDSDFEKLNRLQEAKNARLSIVSEYIEYATGDKGYETAATKYVSTLAPYFTDDLEKYKASLGSYFKSLDGLAEKLFSPRAVLDRNLYWVADWGGRSTIGRETRGSLYKVGKSTEGTVSSALGHLVGGTLDNTFAFFGGAQTTSSAMGYGATKAGFTATGAKFLKAGTIPATFVIGGTYSVVDSAFMSGSAITGSDGSTFWGSDKLSDVIELRNSDTFGNAFDDFLFGYTVTGLYNSNNAFEGSRGKGDIRVRPEIIKRVDLSKYTDKAFEERKLSEIYNILTELGRGILDNSEIAAALNLTGKSSRNDFSMLENQGTPCYPDMDLPLHPYYNHKNSYAISPDFYFWNIYEDGDIKIKKQYLDLIQENSDLALSHSYNHMRRMQAGGIVSNSHRNLYIKPTEITSIEPAKEGGELPLKRSLTHHPEGSTHVDEGSNTKWDDELGTFVNWNTTGATASAFAEPTAEYKAQPTRVENYRRLKEQIAKETDSDKIAALEAQLDVLTKLDKDSESLFRPITFIDNFDNAPAGVYNKTHLKTYYEYNQKVRGIEKMFGSRAGYTGEYLSDSHGVDKTKELAKEAMDNGIAMLDEFTHGFDYDGLTALCRDSAKDILAHKWSMKRAFPTFKLYFIEEDELESRFINFDDFYSFNGVKQFVVNRDRETAADTAVITLQNISGTLDGTKRGSIVDLDYFDEKMEDFIKKKKGGEVETRSNNDQMSMEKDQPFTSIVLRPGINVQLRCGYSNDPNMLEVLLSGRVVDVAWSQNGDLSEITVQSFGAELVQHIKGMNAMNTSAQQITFPATHHLLGTLMLSSEVQHFGRWEFGQSYQYGESKDHKLDTYKYKDTPNFFGLFDLNYSSSIASAITDNMLATGAVITALVGARYGLANPGTLSSAKAFIGSAGAKILKVGDDALKTVDDAGALVNGSTSQGLRIATQGSSVVSSGKWAFSIDGVKNLLKAGLSPLLPRQLLQGNQNLFVKGVLRAKDSIARNTAAVAEWGTTGTNILSKGIGKITGVGRWFVTGGTEAVKYSDDVLRRVGNLTTWYNTFGGAVVRGSATVGKRAEIFLKHTDKLIEALNVGGKMTRPLTKAAENLKVAIEAAKTGAGSWDDVLKAQAEVLQSVNAVDRLARLNAVTNGNLALISGSSTILGQGKAMAGALFRGYGEVLTSLGVGGTFYAFSGIAVDAVAGMYNSWTDAEDYRKEYMKLKANLVLEPQDDNLYPPNPLTYMRLEKLKEENWGTWWNDLSLLDSTFISSIVEFPINVLAESIDFFKTFQMKPKYITKRVTAETAKYVLNNTTIWDIFHEMTLRHPGWIYSPMPYGTKLRYTMFFGVPSQRYWSRPASNNFINRMNRLRDFIGLPSPNEAVLKQQWSYFYGEEDYNISKAEKMSSYAGTFEETDDNKMLGEEYLTEKDYLYDNLRTPEVVESLTYDQVSKQVAMEMSLELKTKAMEEYLLGLENRFIPFRRYHNIDSEKDIVANHIMGSNKNVVNAVNVHFQDLENKTQKTIQMKASSSIKDDEINMANVNKHITNVRSLHMALRYGMGELIYGMKEMYRGELLILGNPRIKPWDICYLFDSYSDMFGPFEVKSVTHTFSHETGFLTEIVPNAVVIGNEISSQPIIEGLKLFVAAVKDRERNFGQMDGGGHAIPDRINIEGYMDLEYTDDLKEKYSDKIKTMPSVEEIWNSLDEKTKEQFNSMSENQIFEALTGYSKYGMQAISEAGKWIPGTRGGDGGFADLVSTGMLGGLGAYTTGQIYTGVNTEVIEKGGEVIENFKGTKLGRNKFMVIGALTFGLIGQRVVRALTEDIPGTEILKVGDLINQNENWLASAPILFSKMMEEEAVCVLPLIKEGKPIVSGMSMRDPMAFWKTTFGVITNRLNDSLRGVRDYEEQSKKYGMAYWSRLRQLNSEIISDRHQRELVRGMLNEDGLNPDAISQSKLNLFYNYFDPAPEE